MAKKRICRADIARLACVSEATVSLALNDNPRVKLSTREQIRQIAREVGYIPNRAARRLSLSGDSGRAIFDHIGFVVFGDSTLLLNESYLLMLIGAEKAASAIRAQLVFARVDLEKDKHRAAMLAQENVDGWLVLGALTDEVLKVVKSWQVPFVVLGDKLSERPTHQVYIDHRQAGRMAVEYLHQRGHQRIAILNGPQCFLYQRQILKGYIEAMNELTGSIDERFIFFCERDTDLPGKVKNAFSLSNSPTAFIQAEKFETTEEITEIFHFIGKNIKDQRDTIVIGLGTINQTLNSHPTITTVGTSLGEIGVKLLVDISSDRNKPAHVLKIMPVLHKPEKQIYSR